MRIHWIVDGVSKDASGAYHARLASNRYRAILPAAGLRARGHEVELVPAMDWDGRMYAGGRASVPDIVIIGKILPGRDKDRYANLTASVLDAVAGARASGIKVVADINDDYFQDPLRGSYWQGLAAAVNGIVAGSAAMAETARIYAHSPVAIVGDPLMAPYGEASVFRPAGTGWKNALLHFLLPNLMPRQRLRLVWYGSAPSWPSMKAWMDRLGAFAAEQPLQIRLVAQPGIGIESRVREFNARFGPEASLEFMPWDENSAWKAVQASHIAIIPSDMRDSGKGRVKTANRLTDALHCGRFVVASPVPAYAEFGDFASLGEDLVAGIRWAIAHPKETLNKIRRGQKIIAERCSVAAIAKAWEEALAAMLADSGGDSRPVPAFPAKPAPVEVSTATRLNLGCGDKPLPGYINVDIAPGRLGRKPDVLCDVRDLRCFADASADELLSVHVIEHFPRWEVPALLREWIRVLKPGGTLIIECPNLLSACEALLANPEAGSEADGQGQKTMWVFYGDPAWKDPLMTHRWGYTPHSLGKLMREAGLVNVRQEPARFKLREPRDMRMVGEKSLRSLAVQRDRGGQLT